MYRYNVHAHTTASKYTNDLSIILPVKYIFLSFMNSTYTSFSNVTKFRPYSQVSILPNPLFQNFPLSFEKTKTNSNKTGASKLIAIYAAIRRLGI